MKGRVRVQGAREPAAIYPVPNPLCECSVSIPQPLHVEQVAAPWSEADGPVSFPEPLHFGQSTGPDSFLISCPNLQFAMAVLPSWIGTQC